MNEEDINRRIQQLIDRKNGTYNNDVEKECEEKIEYLTKLRNALFN